MRMKELPSSPFLSRCLIATLLALVITGCSSKSEPPKGGPGGNQPPTVVDVIVAKLDSVEGNIEVNGEVSANEYVELHPEVSGRLTLLNVPEGANIAQGTVIARINDAELQAQLTKAKSQLVLARQTESRLHKLLAVSGINQADYDLALNQLNSLSADSAILQAQIDKTIIKAPFSGLLGLRQVSPGAYVTPATTIATLQQVQQLKIDFSIPEEFADAVKKGQTVEVVTDLDQGSRQKALVTAIEPQMSRSTRNIKARAMLEGGKSNPGGFVKVYIPVGGTKSSVLVPTNCIIPDAMKKKIVTVKGGKAVFVPVETGLRQAKFVEITSGLQAGDTVVVYGVLFAKPNAPLKVRSVKKLEEIGN
jgi:membrane fusion protein, multidrug efflux system